MKYKLDDYKVGEIAKFYGISVDAVRFYDKRGLLKPEKKGDNNYRSYSKEEFITMDYIIRLRSLGVSIENIKRMAANARLQDALEVVSETEAELEEQICSLENQMRMIRGYKAKLRECAKAYGKVSLVQSPVFIVRDIQNNSMEITMKAFDELQLPTLPLLSIMIDCEDYDDRHLYKRFQDRIERQQICDYVVSAADYQGISKNKEFPKEKFTIIPSQLCAHTIGINCTNVDYSSYETIHAFIENENLRIAAPPFLRILALENRQSAGTEYSEIWIPVE